jgi:proteic killer suppression protein
MIVTRVELTERAFKALFKVPKHISDKFQTWVDAVELLGLEEVRKRPGFHDEPLRGDRRRQRSIRLSKAYRAIYFETDSEIRIVRILEVNKHEY